jgi:hypothetical protein
MRNFTFTEGDLQIQIKGVVDARKFDEPSSHGLNNCMKAVDFIVELNDSYLFIEFKDPQAPGAKGKAQQKNFIQDFQSGKIEEALKYKYRDSFLYEWASGKADKPIHYLVLVALDTLTKVELGKRTDALKNMLPLQKSRSSPWPRPFVASCRVFNLATWNQQNVDLPVTRLSIP